MFAFVFATCTGGGRGGEQVVADLRRRDDHRPGRDALQLAQQRR
jgi:hypothetical protein